MSLGRPLRAADAASLVSRLALASALLACAAGVARGEVQIRARLLENRIGVGESAPLEVVVTGASGRVSDPDVPVPRGMQVLGTSRSQSFSWINGKSTAQTSFRIELGADYPGTFVVGPIRVRIGSQWYQSGSVTVEVAGAREGVPSTGRSPAALLLDVSPSHPYVGQPAILRVRLIQRAPLAEDPQYSPPATPGFWGEKSTAPESYYADQASGRVLVTETRARLYPLAAGMSQIGEAGAVLTLAMPSSGRDPFDWLQGGGSRRQIAVRSAPVAIAVRALPPGAPEGFDGAVGQLQATWQADRRRTAVDVPATLWLDVRGSGNLPLLRTPQLVTPDADVFSSTVQDSLGPPGTLASGRRRFLWTVLPHHTGPLHIDPPRFVWFDYAAGHYVVLDGPAIEIDVEPPIHGPGSGLQTLPTTFAVHPVDPFAQPANPWGLAAAGACLGLAILAFRRVLAHRNAPRARVPGWVQGLRHSQGAAFWAAASRACDELASRGVDVAPWRRRVEEARYGAGGAEADTVRDSLLAVVDTAPAPKGSAAPLWALALGGLALGVVFAALAWPRSGNPMAAQACLEADRAVTAGDVDAAVRRWRAVWTRGGHHPGVAARIAWASARSGALADASAWVLRGDRGEPRDAALSWVTDNVRDAGGLAGFKHLRVPVRTIEWALAAAACGIGLGWASRRVSIGLAALAVLLAGAPALDRARSSHVVRGVVREPVVLEGEGAELVAGQVVTVRERGPRVRVEVGSGIAGRVPAAAVEIVEPR